MAKAFALLAGVVTMCADNVSGSHFQNEANGRMPPRIREAIDAFFREYGPYIQFFELGNEPCMFGGETVLRGSPRL